MLRLFTAFLVMGFGFGAWSAHARGQETPPTDTAQPTDSPEQAEPVDADPVDAEAEQDEAPASFAAGAIVTISGDISDVTTESLKRRVEAARKAGAEIIIFEINTPGGMVSSALDICAYIKKLTDVKTVAWVNSDAYSAGSMISMACNEIVMAPGSTIGDCGVILGGPTGPQEVPEALRAKAESPVLEQFRDSAAMNNYDPLLCEALVVKERVVYWIEHIESGERRFVNQEDKVRLVGADKSDSPFARAEESSDAEPPAWRLVESYMDVIKNQEIKVIQPVVSANELLTMSQSRATAFGFCKAIIADEAQLLRHYHIAGELARSESNWSENLTGWLTSMPVRMFLLVILLLGVYVEFNTPGVGVPGAVALVCLGIFVGAPYLTGLANVWEIVIVLIGFALLAVEIFVIPGFGVAGVSGIVCIIVGMLATFIPEEPGRNFPLYWPQMEQGLTGLVTGIKVLVSGSAASIVAMIIFSRVLPHVTWLHGVMPENPLPAAVTLSDPYHGYARIGDVGIVESTLRPSGKVRFGDMLVDAVTEGDYVEPKTDVQVIERSGNRVVVRRMA